MLQMQLSIYFNFLLLFFLQYETFSYWDYEMEKDFWKEEIWKQIFWQMFPNLKKKNILKSSTRYSSQKMLLFSSLM